LTSERDALQKGYYELTTAYLELKLEHQSITATLTSSPAQGYLSYDESTVSSSPSSMLECGVDLQGVDEGLCYSLPVDPSQSHIECVTDEPAIHCEEGAHSYYGMGIGSAMESLGFADMDGAELLLLDSTNMQQPGMRGSW
jgi:hypothetical protein